MMNEMWREKTLVNERGARSYKRDGYGLHNYRHQKTARENHRRGVELQKKNMAAAL